MESNPDSLAALVDHLQTKFPNLTILKVIASRTDEEFDDAIETLLEQAVDYMERNANSLESQDEVSITMTLVGCLTIPGLLRVTQETHSKGHVDITIEAEITPPVRRRLGEAKIYSGPAYHVKGLQQLVGRYTTGREGSSILVEYVKEAGIKGLVDKIRTHMDDNKPCCQYGETEDHRIRWAFTSMHDHSSGEKIRVLHLSCNLHKNYT